MTARSVELSAFLATLQLAILERAKPGSESLLIIKKVMQVLEMPTLEVAQPVASKTPLWLPVCELLNDAVQDLTARALNKPSTTKPSTHPISFPSNLVDHAQALNALAPKLSWWRRPNTDHLGNAFADGHANAMVIGRGGLEEHEDISIGISLMAPGVEYPEHHHLPEEVYLVLSPGYWNQAGGNWYEPGIGGLVYNPSDILHSMQSRQSPLLATWCLWHEHD